MFLTIRLYYPAAYTPTYSTLIISSDGHPPPNRVHPTPPEALCTSSGIVIPPPSPRGPRLAPGSPGQGLCLIHLWVPNEGRAWERGEGRTLKSAGPGEGAAQRGPGRRAGGPGFLGRWLRRARAAGLQLGQARPRVLGSAGESRAGGVTSARGGGADGIHTPPPTPPHPHLLEGGGRLQAGDDWDDRQTHGETASQGKCRGGGGVGVRQTDKDGVLRRLADRWGRGSQEKNGQT